MCRSRSHSSLHPNRYCLTLRGNYLRGNFRSTAACAGLRESSLSPRPRERADSPTSMYPKRTPPRRPSFPDSISIRFVSSEGAAGGGGGRKKKKRGGGGGG